MTDAKLMKSLSRLVLPMFEPSEELDVNETLAEVIKSRDTRLWEGFPVLLANAADTYQFAYDQVEKQLSAQEDKTRFHRLLLLSLSLYSFYHLSFSWSNSYRKRLTSEDAALVKQWRNDLARNRTLAWDDLELDPQRLKGLFELYFEQNADKSRQRKEKYEEYSLAFALSQMFSPKQKEWFKKRLEGLPLTKTELEYYSRSVKKKVVALANAELHALARKLLEK